MSPTERLFIRLSGFDHEDQIHPCHSHDGQRRDLRFRWTGSTSSPVVPLPASPRSEIIEYCMGRSRSTSPGIIRDKVAWFTVIYQFEKEQVLLPPTPAQRWRCSYGNAAEGCPLQMPKRSGVGGKY